MTPPNPLIPVHTGNQVVKHDHPDPGANVGISQPNDLDPGMHRDEWEKANL